MFIMGTRYSHLRLEERCRLRGLVEIGVGVGEIARRLGRHRSTIFTRGQRAQMCSTMRAEIEVIRQNGYATDDEEFIAGMVALAVPILESNRRLLFTLSFHAPTQRFDVARALEFLPQLRASAAELSQLILS